MKKFTDSIHTFKLNHHHKHKKKFKSHYKMYNDELCRLHRSFKYVRPILVLVSLLILSLLYNEIGITKLGLVLVIVIVSKEVVHQLILIKLDKSILRPVSKIKEGVEEISKGNYDVRIKVCENNKHCVKNELGMLIDSFNNMAEKLKKSEELKKVYDHKRKILVANISHDLKTPIASVQGYIEAIVDNKDIDKENLEKYLQVINKNTLYMNKLIDDLFLFSKLDMNKLEFNFEEICIREYMNDLVEEFMFEAEERNILFKYENLIKDNFLIHIDRKRIHQSIRNIIDNAYKYSGNKKLEITLTLFKNNGYAGIEIKDNGKGIAKENLPSIFDSFYKVDRERTKDYGSSGLGLSISKEIIESHSGKIEVKSELEKGTCFKILIPKFNNEGQCF